MKNYYEILEIPVDAGFGEIKSAYRNLAKRCHPDIVESGGEDFHKLKEAFETLSDPARRRDYDRIIGLYKPLNNSYRDYRVNVSPIVQDVYDDLLNVISDRFHLPRRRVLNFELYLNDHEFSNGAKTRIAIPQEKICPACFGFGGSLLHVCRSCEGAGMVDYKVDFDVILEPPLRPGQIYELVEGNHLLRFTLKRGDING